LEEKNVWHGGYTEHQVIPYSQVIFSKKSLCLRLTSKCNFLQEIFKVDHNSKFTFGQSTLKNWTKKIKNLLTTISLGQFLKIKCLKPINFSQHHNEAKY